MASTNDERRAVKHVDGVVLDRNGLPTFVVRGKEYIHVDHAGASYLYSQAAPRSGVGLNELLCATEPTRNP